MRTETIVVNAGPGSRGVDMGAVVDLLAMLALRWPGATVANVPGAVLAVTVDLDAEPDERLAELLEAVKR